MKWKEKTKEYEWPSWTFLTLPYIKAKNSPHMTIWKVEVNWVEIDVKEEEGATGMLPNTVGYDDELGPGAAAATSIFVALFPSPTDIWIFWFFWQWPTSPLVK